MTSFTRKIAAFTLKNLEKSKSNFASKNRALEIYKFIDTFGSNDEIFNVKADKPYKSDEEAEKCRVEGNKQYKQNHFGKALQLYNESILISPHPQVKKQDASNEHFVCEADRIMHSYDIDGNTFKSLALAFSNRSAVLFVLRQYKRCIADCNLALVYGNSNDLASKLLERKAKCYVALHRVQSSKKTMKDFIKDLRFEQELGDCAQSNLESLLGHCLIVQSKNKDKKYSRSDDEPPINNIEGIPLDYLFTYDCVEPPQLTEKNEKIPCLSSAVRVGYSSEQGRYLVANRDILPGEVLIVEKPYSDVLEWEYMKSFCSLCTKRTITPIPCPSCSNVVFCSEMCRSEALMKFHSVECNILKSLHEMDAMEFLLPLRMVIQTTFEKIKNEVPELDKKIETTSPEDRGYNEQGIYDSQDYCAIYNLETNIDSTDRFMLVQYAIASKVLVKLLKDGQCFFQDKDGEIQVTKTDDEILGCTLIKHIIQAAINTYSIRELEIDLSIYGENSLKLIGSIICGVHSLCNHSCDPSAIRTRYKNVYVLRSAVCIPVNSQITLCYYKEFTSTSFNDRQENLLKQYHFTCKCDACLNRWPMHNLSTIHSVKCLKCSAQILSNKICSGCKMSYRSNVKYDGIKFNLSSFEFDLNNDSNYYSLMLQNISISNEVSLENVNFVERFLGKYKHICLPDHSLLSLIRTLSDFYDCLSGSSYIISNK